MSEATRIAIRLLTLTLILGAPGLLFAQDSRADAIAAEQAKKAAEAKPYEPSGAERWATKLKNEFLLEPSGFYPYFGSVYSGGGFTLGAGYRQFTGDRTHWDVKGLYSFKNYKNLEFSTDSWGHSHGRVDLHAKVGWRDAPQVAYFGLGMDSPEDRTNFRLLQTYTTGSIIARPGYLTVFGAEASYDINKLEEGAGTVPSIEEVFTPATAPGLGDSPNYLRTSVWAGIDSRPSPGYARRGGLYQITYHNYADVDDTYSFDRVDGEIVQHLPVLRENWVISLHGLVQTTLNDEDVVPYFLLPSLGSGSTLRAYQSGRYRDRHSLLLSGEVRWFPSRLGIDMAVFYDMGKVAPFWDGLSLNGLKSDVGIGARFHTPFATPLRIELAHGRSGMNLVFSGSAAF
jgi:hypothetical protein